MQTPGVISGADALLAECGGEWPYFHDADVLMGWALCDGAAARICFVVQAHLLRPQRSNFGWALQRPLAERGKNA
ncbi:MAG: hypothetical protein JWP60_4871 [Ramlibacter sp.]|nr:hypothetical protein [Ramlibacter sp.]